MIHMAFESKASGAIPFTIKGTSQDPGRQARALAKEYKRRGMSMDAERDQLIRLTGQHMEDALKREAPRKTGVFADGIRASYHRAAWGGETVMIDVFGDHAFLLPFIIKGTKAHLIPKGGAAEMLAKGYPLRFWWEKGPRGPSIYFYWSVMHPGTQPNDFVSRALDAEMPIIRAAFGDLIMNVKASKMSKVI